MAGTTNIIVTKRARQNARRARKYHYLATHLLKRLEQAKRGAAVSLVAVAVVLGGCNSAGFYEFGNVHLDYATIPSVLGSSATVVNSCAKGSTDSIGNCPYNAAGPPSITYQTGLLASLFGPMLMAGSIAYAGHQIGRMKADTSTNNFNASSALSSDVSVRGGWYRAY